MSEQEFREMVIGQLATINEKLLNLKAHLCGIWIVFGIMGTALVGTFIAHIFIPSVQAAILK